MKSILVAMLLLLSSPAAARMPSLSGHWQNAGGNRFFLHHKANGDAYVWTVVAGRQIGFEKGSLTLLSPKDDLVGSLYEINVRSDETMVTMVGGRACEIRDLSFSLLGVLKQWGWRGRYMELGAVGHVSGTLVCGQNTSPWAMPYAGSWRRL